jgi:hypothetical protein
MRFQGAFFCYCKKPKFAGMDEFPKKHDPDPEDYYLSPEGFIVFTEKYHLKRGYCCMSGCRHCPYGYNKKTGKVENPGGKR